MSKKFVLNIDRIADGAVDNISEMYPDLEKTPTKSKLREIIRHVAETGKDDDNYLSEESGEWFFDEIEREHYETYGTDVVTKRIKRGEVREIIKKHIVGEKKRD